MGGGSVGQSVHQFETTIGWTVTEIYTDIHGLHWMNLSEFVDLLTSPLAPP